MSLCTMSMTQAATVHDIARNNFMPIFCELAVTTKSVKGFCFISVSEAGGH